MRMYGPYMCKRSIYVLVRVSIAFLMAITTNRLASIAPQSISTAYLPSVVSLASPKSILVPGI